MNNMEPKKSEIIKNLEVVFPQDTNHYGPLFGGTLLAWMDKTGYYAAARFCGSPAVTVSIEHADFSVPLMNGDQVGIHARVIYSGKHSMVVKVDAYREDLYGQDKPTLATTGYFTYVSIDESRNPQPVPPVLLEDNEEHKLHQVGEEVYQQAKVRRMQRGRVR